MRVRDTVQTIKRRERFVGSIQSLYGGILQRNRLDRRIEPAVERIQQGIQRRAGARLGILVFQFILKRNVYGGIQLGDRLVQLNGGNRKLPLGVDKIALRSVQACDRFASAPVFHLNQLALFKYQITDEKLNYNGYTLNITSDIDLGAGFWRPINPINNLTINGNGHTISNLLVRSCTNSNGYGFGFIGNATGKVTISDLTFDKADVAIAKGLNYYGNVGAVVLAYAYGTTEFDNVRVINSSLNGYGKIGMLLGMGADPGVKVTFKDCVSRDNTIRAVYNIGGLAGNIQRGNGVDNATVENCTVQNINVICNTNDYIDLNNVTVTVKSNDLPGGTDVIKTVSGKYWICSGYYWGGYADYYVSYGDSSYDAPVEGHTEPIANSEYCVNQ